MFWFRPGCGMPPPPLHGGMFGRRPHRPGCGCMTLLWIPLILFLLAMLRYW